MNFPVTTPKIHTSLARQQRHALREHIFGQQRGTRRQRKAQTNLILRNCGGLRLEVLGDFSEQVAFLIGRRASSPAGEINIRTEEDPVESIIDGISQMTVNSDEHFFQLARQSRPLEIHATSC